MSETAHARPHVAKFCTGLGLDIGFGGDKIVPEALSMDLPKPYTKVGEDKQILRGEAGRLDFLCDEVLDYIYSSHLVEDFTYPALVQMLKEWRRVLKPNGLLIIVAPDEGIYSAHCRATGQPYNAAHKNKDFSLGTFMSTALQAGMWQRVAHSHQLIGTYSWWCVLRKI